MEKNHIAHESAFTLEAAAYEHASPSNPRPAPAEPDEPAFATEAKADAYWAGVCDGIRNQGGMPAPRLAARARDSYPELVATADELRDRDILDFDPVSLRHRIDGWTPQKQREYVEALADSGVARYAAARVGMSEQSANRLRRRADARGFDRACEAAMRLGARRLLSVAFERAIEGTIKRHYYHGEVKSEERVYDNRLLIALIGKLGHLLAPNEEVEPVAANWQPWMEAIEQGLPEPPAADETVGAEPVPAGEPDAFDPEADEGEWTGAEVWQDEDGSWWTEFPPADDFDGEEEGEFGNPGYRRTLSPEEQAVVESDKSEELAVTFEEQSARRDRYFGWTDDSERSDDEVEDVEETEVSTLKGPEPYETSEPSGEAAQLDANRPH